MELTREQITKHVRFAFNDVALADVGEALDQVDSFLERFESWGLNPDKVRVSDFEIGAYLPIPANTPFPFVSAGPLLVFVKGGIALAGIQAFPPRGRHMPMFHFPTANSLVDLAARAAKQ